ncbi:MAG TPA: AIM24 family protein [Jatrophihabitans sp.]|uniref:AIM24 family protein n=1 Tax=Jatrophihabitans sp. TaxID=1932789 RepID=UPI002DF8FFE1|nr:AIM24 family protein [Jatrophihabitans sp.]
MLDIQLTGNAMQMAIVRLQPGQVVYSEAGKFLFSSADVQMETRFGQPSGSAPPAGGGGALGGLLRGAVDAGKRMLAGESLALCHFSSPGGDGLLALAGVLPGEMQVLELDGTRTWFAEKDAFVAAEAGVNFDIAFSGLRQGFSGGEGFVLEKFTGRGSLLIAGAGNFIEVNPADHGGTLKVDTGCVVAWDDRISYGIERVGALNRQGIVNAVFGGEGFNLATLRGDGRVILQSMTITGLAGALAKAAEHSRDSRSGNTNGATGLGSLGGIFGNSG